MTTYNFFVDIGIPLISALLDGFVTMWGVILTIRHEKKKGEEQSIQSVKPWIFSLNEMENYDRLLVNRIALRNPASSNVAKKYMIIKNTDHGIGIIQYLKTENKTYYPIFGKLLEKGSVTEIELYFCEGETLKNLVFVVSDVFGNQYQYEVIQSTHAWQIKEMIDGKKHSTD